MAELSATAAAPPHRHPRLLGALTRSPAALVGAAILVAWIVIAIGAPWIAPYDPAAIDPAAEPVRATAHWLGIDAVGRDLWSCLVWGSRNTFTVVPLAVGAAFLAGAAIGFTAGYRGGWADVLARRLGDVLLSLPAFLLYIVLFTAFGPSLLAIVIVVTVAYAPGIAAIARAQVRALRDRDYVRAAQARGEPGLWILLGEILPNAGAPLLAALPARAGHAVVLTATLGFFDLGPPSALPDWGRMVAEGVEQLGTHWGMAAVPGFALMSVVLACNLLADGMRRGAR